MLTQIYEISTPEEARSISEIGVDHIGVLAGNGEFPRELSLDAVSRVAAAILPPSKLSLLFLTTDLSLIAAWAGQLDPAIVHLGAAPELLSPADTAIPKSRLSGPLIMRSIPVVGETSIALARSYEGIAVSCSWTAIGHPIGRLALSECRMIGRSAGASMSKFRHLLSWPGVLDRIMSSRRSALYGLPASIQKPRPTGTGLTRRIWTE